MRILVTGAGGYAGAWLCRRLAQAGHAVVALQRPGSPRRAPTAPSLSVAEADLRHGLPDAIGAIDAIVHTAAQSRPDPRLPLRAYVENNILATQAVADFARRQGARVVVNFSSTAVYGPVPCTVVDGDTPGVPAQPYGQTKALAEAVLREIAAEVPSVSLRLPGIVGPGAEGPWLMRVLAACRAGEEVTVANPDGLFNSVVHVDDLAGFAMTLAERPPRGAVAVTLGAEEPLTIRETVSLLIEHTGGRARLVETPGGGGYRLCNARARRLGWAPPTLADLLRRLATEEFPA